MKKLVETTNSRIYSHITEDDNWAIVSPYRSENDDKTNEKLMSQFKSEVRNSGYGFIQFVSRWVENGEAFDESSLLIPNCTKEDALKFGKEYHQSSVIVRDDDGCNEICTTSFEDENKQFNYGDIVRTYNLSGDKVMNYEDAEAIFSKRKGGPASMPKNKTGRKNLKPFRLSEVYEVSQSRPSYFQNKGSRKLIFKKGDCINEALGNKKKLNGQFLVERKNKPVKEKESAKIREIIDVLDSPQGLAQRYGYTLTPEYIDINNGGRTYITKAQYDRLKELGYGKEENNTAQKNVKPSGRWKYQVDEELAVALRNAIDDEDLLAVCSFMQLIYDDIYDKINDEEIFSERELTSYKDDIDWLDLDAQDAEYAVDYELSNLYDFCDNVGVWIPTHKMTESLEESSKDVSLDKMSKKDRKAFYDKQRNTWGRSPVTRTKPSDKIYDRKKFKKDDLNESEGERRTIVPDKNYHVLHWVSNEDVARDYGNLPGSDIKGMLKGYKYDDELDMWFSRSGKSGYSITEIRESLDEADETKKEVNVEVNKESNKCPNCGRNLIKDGTGLHCPVCDKKHNDSEFNTSSKGVVTEEFDDTFDVADFEPHNKDEFEFDHNDDIKGIEEIRF